MKVIDLETCTLHNFVCIRTESNGVKGNYVVMESSKYGHTINDISKTVIVPSQLALQVFEMVKKEQGKI